VELAAEGVELLTPPPGGDTQARGLDPEAVRQAVRAVAASRRLHLLCGPKSGDSDPEAAEVMTSGRVIGCPSTSCCNGSYTQGVRLGRRV